MAARSSHRALGTLPLPVAARRFAFVARNVPGRCRCTFLGWSRRGRFWSRRSRHFGHDLIEKCRPRVRPLFLSPFAMAIWMLGETGLADYLRHLALDHAGNGMVQKQSATWAVIVDQIAEPFCRNGHKKTFRLSSKSRRILQGL
jgi:hypothetical protein